MASESCDGCTIAASFTGVPPFTYRDHCDARGQSVTMDLLVE
ncbi:MAG TPA: hypothetical protein VF618_11355 [Thermoanaerobaculia bacterium]